MPEMLWRWKLLKKTSNQIIKTRSFSSIHNISSPILDNMPSKSFAAKHSKEISDNSKIVVLTPQIVVSTLLNCPSDLVALSFFLWCARQPDYFHERRAFDHMVVVVNRLTQRFKTVEGIIGQLESVGFVTKPQTLLLLLRIYWRGGKYSLVFETFEEMIKYGYTPNTFARNIVLDVLFKIGRVNEALSVLKETQVFLTWRLLWVEIFWWKNLCFHLRILCTFYILSSIPPMLWLDPLKVDAIFIGTKRVVAMRKSMDHPSPHVQFTNCNGLYM